VLHANQLLDDLLAMKAPIIGLGLDSAEVGYPPSLFVDVFAKARAEGLHVVAHAGEEGPPDYIWQVLDLLKVERIDHGVRCLEDEALVNRLVEEQIPLTVCPLSNVRLKVIDDVAQLPLRQMLDRGLSVSINSDDPAYFGGYVDDNFSALEEGMGLTADERTQLAENSVRASFATT
jgi:adenosine deaminase